MFGCGSGSFRYANFDAITNLYSPWPAADSNYLTVLFLWPRGLGS